VIGDGGMEGWRDEGWRDGGMEGWRDGGMRDGGMRGWRGWRDEGMEGDEKLKKGFVISERCQLCNT